MTDNIVFKFRKVDKHLLQSLINSEIYFALPNRLNDPYDCRVDICQSLENAITKSASPSRERLEQLRGLKGRFDKVQSDIASVGVCSFSLDPENTLLWVHYADAHRGVCLAYRFSEAFFYENADDILGIVQVVYGDNSLSDWFAQFDPIIHNSDECTVSLIKKALSVKSKQWEYEKEVRIIRKSDGAYGIARHDLIQVCFGLDTPKSDVNLVKRILHQSGYNGQLCRIIRRNDVDFGLKTVEM